MSDESKSSERLRRAEQVLAERALSSERLRPDSVEALCRAHPDIAEELRALLPLMDALANPAPEPLVQLSEMHAEMLERQRASDPQRYERIEEIESGGMGSVLRVLDRRLGREVALKRSRVRGETDGLRWSDAVTLRRFLDEARVTGRLEHPGIVPVHDFGVDERGGVYFTMRLVRGRSFLDVIRAVRDGEEGWSQIRAVRHLLAACETVSYAHSMGVLHRDLKPGNLMVGDFGAVYVVDWGLARIRGGELAETSDDPLRTRHGQVVGTPAYMPPEQSRGELDRIDERSDVYALGAVLYHLLAGAPPFLASDDRQDSAAVLQRVREGPPESLARLAPQAPQELVAICERAMARDPGQRYPSAEALAGDLRAFLEGRVVAAYARGALQQLRKWIVRNRALAAALAFGLFAVLVGAGAALWLAREARRAAELARAQTRAVLSLSALQDLQELKARAETLWPPSPERIPEYEAWVARARALIDGVPPQPGDEARPGLREHEAELTALERRAERVGDSTEGLRFASPEDRWWHSQLDQLVRRLRALDDPDTGLLRGAAPPGQGWGIRRRLEFAQAVGERSVHGELAAARWQDCLRTMAESPRYAGLSISPQLGLLPLGPDPESGLQEFAHLQSGEPAARRPDGKLEIRHDTGIVLVLIPGGSYWMGAQKDDPGARHYDPEALPDEGPVHLVELSPYFLSKYEMTQGQWQRLSGAWPKSWMLPDSYKPAWNRRGLPWTPLLPVEQVSAPDSELLLARAGLCLPTEAQWEVGARGGTPTPYWCGTDPACLALAGNVADAYARSHEGAHWDVAMEAWDDGHTYTGEVTAFAPNPFGLVGTHGNVWEWCADGSDLEAYSKLPRSDPVHPLAAAGEQIVRSGGFDYSARFSRSSYRFRIAPEVRMYALGLRPARTLKVP